MASTFFFVFPGIKEVLLGSSYLFCALTGMRLVSQASLSGSEDPGGLTPSGCGHRWTLQPARWILGLPVYIFSYIDLKKKKNQKPGGFSCHAVRHGFFLPSSCFIILSWFSVSSMYLLNPTMHMGGIAKRGHREREIHLLEIEKCFLACP